MSGLMANTTLAQAPAEKKPDAKPATPAARPALRDRSEILAKQLNLSDEQKPKVKAIVDEERKKFLDLTATAKNLSLPERQAKAKEIRETTNVKMKEVLTPEQYEKYIKPGLRVPAVRPGATPPAGGAPPPAAPPAK
jgi:Spy/CpxP family protein refolding chaperone